MFNFDPKIFKNKARIIFPIRAKNRFLTHGNFQSFISGNETGIGIDTRRNGQGGSLTLLDKPNRYYRDAIGGRTLSKFPKRIPRFGLQSYNNELARNWNVPSGLYQNRFSRHVGLVMDYIADYFDV